MDKLELTVKLRTMLISERATWTTAQQNEFPDSSFMYVCPGGEKKAGITSPKSLRKLVYKDANGKIDLPHVRNALARVNQVKCGDEVISDELQNKLRGRLQKALAQGKKCLKSNSLSRAIAGVSQAFDLEFANIKSSDGGRQHYISEVMDDAVIVDSWDEFNTFYKVKYSIKNSAYTFASREKWVQGNYQFTPNKK